MKTILTLSLILLISVCTSVQGKKKDQDVKVNISFTKQNYLFRELIWLEVEIVFSKGLKFNHFPSISHESKNEDDDLHIRVFDTLGNQYGNPLEGTSDRFFLKQPKDIYLPDTLYLVQYMGYGLWDNKYEPLWYLSIYLPIGKYKVYAEFEYQTKNKNHKIKSNEVELNVTIPDGSNFMDFYNYYTLRSFLKNSKNDSIDQRQINVYEKVNRFIAENKESVFSEKLLWDFNFVMRMYLSESGTISSDEKKFFQSMIYKYPDYYSNIFQFWNLYYYYDKEKKINEFWDFINELKEKPDLTIVQKKIIRMFMIFKDYYYKNKYE